MKFKVQEYEDLMSAISIALENAPKDSPNFKKSLHKLSKKLWKKEWREYLTTSLSERVIKQIRAERDE